MSLAHATQRAGLRPCPLRVPDTYALYDIRPDIFRRGAELSEGFGVMP